MFNNPMFNQSPHSDNTDSDNDKEAIKFLDDIE